MGFLYFSMGMGLRLAVFRLRPPELHHKGLYSTSLGFIANVRCNKVKFLQYKLEVNKRTLIFVSSFEVLRKTTSKTLIPF